MEKILVSKCLMGFKVRYHGELETYNLPLLKKWKDEGRLTMLCPEVQAGAPIPRPPSEIVGSGGGLSVLNNEAKIINAAQVDETALYSNGAKLALSLIQENNIKLAILKDGSPSCGNTFIYDGSFTGETTPGEGVVTALLRENNVKVFAETQLQEAEQYLISIDPSYES